MRKPYYKIKENDARAIVNNCPISRKFSIELCREIRYKPVKKVQKYLDDIIALKRHVPLLRYFHDVGHKKGPAISGVKAGRFPVKAAKYFKKVLEMALANADYKGFDVANKPLFIRGAVVSNGVKRISFQAKGHRRMRRDQTVNIEIIVKQFGKIEKKKQEQKKEIEQKKEEKVEPKSKDEEKELEKKESIEKTELLTEIKHKKEHLEEKRYAKQENIPKIEQKGTIAKRSGRGN